MVSLMTTDRIILPPSPEVLQWADVLEEAIHEFVRIRDGIRHLGRYEADIEAMLLMNLIIRYVEGVLVMARHDLVLQPSACVIGRAVMEISARTIWLLTLPKPLR